MNLLPESTCRSREQECGCSRNTLNLQGHTGVQIVLDCSGQRVEQNRTGEQQQSAISVLPQIQLLSHFVGYRRHLHAAAARPLANSIRLLFFEVVGSGSTTCRWIFQTAARASTCYSKCR